MHSLTVRDSQMIDIDVSGPLPELVLDDKVRGAIREVRVLVRLHDRPVGSFTVEVGPRGIAAAELAAAVWADAPELRAHLAADGFPVPDTLDADGLPVPEKTPQCVERRRAALEDPPSVTVLIATRDREESLRRCLASVAELDYPDFDVVVVDNAPATDATAALVGELDGRCGPAKIRYVREDRPGLARAHNRGLQETTGAWVAITDDDVVVDRNWLTAIAEGARSTPGVACVTGLIVAAELETHAQRLIEEAGGFSRGFVSRLYDTGPNRPDDPLFPFTTGRLGSGANMAFDTAVLRALGGFDPAMGAGTPARGGDDLLAFLNVLASGKTLAYQPAALISHFHRREYEGLQRQSHNYGVGLGAYLTSAVVHHPRLLPGMLRNAVLGLKHFLARSSVKNKGKTAHFPAELERAERRGVLHGPFAYAVSRWDGRSHRAYERPVRDRGRVPIHVPRQTDRAGGSRMSPAR
ncbi:MAG TPA: glycosyltransferase family A protein [Amycolatopsis sp.]|nr:glycosyltransferase family A protein [Amycolatopsis sp.]